MCSSDLFDFVNRFGLQEGAAKGILIEIENSRPAIPSACRKEGAPDFVQRIVGDGFIDDAAHILERPERRSTEIEHARFEGRLTGSNGERLASEYLSTELKRIGARPLPGRSDFLLPFEFTAGSRDGELERQEEVASTRQRSSADALELGREVLACEPLAV